MRPGCKHSEVQASTQLEKKVKKPFNNIVRVSWGLIDIVQKQHALALNTLATGLV